MPRSATDVGARRNVIDELVGVRESDTLNYVIFLDDSFTTDNRWVLEYCGLHAEKVGVGFSAGARVDAVTSEMLHELARAGCRHLGFGVESGSPRVRREIMRRFTSDEQIRNAFVWAKDAGILATANYIIGLPGETAADIEMTLALHERLEPDDFQWFVYHPLPGTRLFDLCRERGYLPDDFLDRSPCERESVLSLPDLSQSDIQYYCDKFAAAHGALCAKRCASGGAAPGPTDDRGV